MKFDRTKQYAKVVFFGKKPAPQKSLDRQMVAAFESVAKHAYSFIPKKLWRKVRFLLLRPGFLPNDPLWQSGTVAWKYEP